MQLSDFLSVISIVVSIVCAGYTYSINKKLINQLREMKIFKLAEMLNFKWFKKIFFNQKINGNHNIQAGRDIVFTQDLSTQIDYAKNYWMNIAQTQP